MKYGIGWEKYTKQINQPTKQELKSFALIFLLPRLYFTWDPSTSTTPEWCRSLGYGSCNQFIICCLCHSFLFTLSHCFSVGFFPRVTVFHKLFQHGSVPYGTVFKEQITSLYLSPPVRKHVSACAVHRLQLCSGHIFLFWCGVLQRLQKASMFQWTVCSTMVLSIGLQKNLCSGVRSTSILYFCNELGRAVCLYIVSLFSLFFFFLTLKPQTVLHFVSPISFTWLVPLPD